MKNRYNVLGRQWWLLVLWALGFILPAGAQTTVSSELTLTAPTYNCQSGFITFNSSGGDGSPITYSAPGISRVNVTDNFGIVEQGLRNDPKPITITATQSGYTTNYAFDLKQFCAEVGDVFPPVLTEPIPDQILVVGQNIEPGSVNLGKYFRDPNGFPRYRPFWTITSSGLPEGVGLATRNIDENVSPFISLFGTPVRTGSYTVTINAALPKLGVSTMASFKIIVTGTPANPPTGGSLTLTQPTYNCQTGAITFNTTGGDGSPITYSALGISRANVTDNFGTVEQGLRNDPKPITITATQSGQTVSYTFDFGAFCSNVPTNGTLKLLAPTVECRSLDASLIINTTGGDGSPITYTVPGAMLSSPASNTVNVFECINADNPSLSIQATQSGYTATYSLDLYRACPNTNFGDALIARQIPDLTLSVGQTLQAYDVSPYFTDPNNFLRYNLVASYTFLATGMPEGINYSLLGTNSTNGLVAKFLGTAPSQPGVYTVTITAGTIFCDPVVTSFKIIVTGTPVNPPTGGTLTLTQPKYNCQTGAITLNTSGGDGSPITYSAPGISRANVTDNFGTVESGLRNDPKPITITATQNGQTVSYVFDFGAFCSGNPQPPVAPTILPPVVNGPIPALTRRADSGRLNEPFVLSQYFSDPTPAHAGYRSNLRFSVDESAPGFFAKLPPGYFLKDLSGVESPYAVIAGTPTLEGIYTVTVTATNLNLPPPNNSVSTTLSIQIIGRSESNPDNALRLTYPLYNCQTGVIVFNLLSRTTYNPEPIVYTAPGVILDSPASMTGIVEPGLRTNPGPIMITATQNGETAQYVFDLKAQLSAYCGYVPGQPPVNPPTGGTLTLLAPDYDCGSGALTFKTSGGDGSPIEYQTAGITGWTTNPNQFVDRDSRTANDVKPFTLMARQNGQVVTYAWDLKATCGRARIGSLAPEFTPTLTVLGNPVVDQLRVVIRGAAGGLLRIQLTDMRGRLIENRLVEPTAGDTEQVFDVSQQAPGLLLLRAITGKQVLTTKVLKR